MHDDDEIECPENDIKSPLEHYHFRIRVFTQEMYLRVKDLQVPGDVLCFEEVTNNHWVTFIIEVLFTADERFDFITTLDAFCAIGQLGTDWHLHWRILTKKHPKHST